MTATIAIMRRIVGDAGNTERLYLAVKAAEQVSADNERLQWKRFIYLARGAGGSARGLTLGPSNSGRSAEPHLALAKELDLLEVPANRARVDSPSVGRWLVTPHAGRAFLSLWELDGRRPPTYFLLAQVLKSDRTFMLPFLAGVIDRGMREAPMVAAIVWEELWNRYPLEMAGMEPPLPRTLYRDGRSLKRTAKHHSDARLRLLVKEEGLNLQTMQLRRLVTAFEGFESRPLPSDIYFRIGWALEEVRPEPMEEDAALAAIVSAHAILQRSGLASSIAIFSYINELSLPKMAVDWAVFQRLLRSSGRFSLYSGLLRNDCLVSLKQR